MAIARFERGEEFSRVALFFQFSQDAQSIDGFAAAEQIWINFLWGHATDLQISSVGDEESRKIKFAFGSGTGVIGVSAIAQLGQSVGGVILRVQAIIMGFCQALQKRRHAAGVGPINRAALFDIMGLQGGANPLQRQRQTTTAGENGSDFRAHGFSWRDCLCGQRAQQHQHDH